jgi:peptidoglycan/LPS O-acetylase OafA/YrhL
VLGLSSPLLKPFALGWMGVDVFFALSGFLITGILLDSKSAPRYFVSFYARRALRIFPLYYLALLAVLLLQIWIPDAGVWGAHDGLAARASLVWPAAFMQNVALSLPGPGSNGITTHYWSLAVEEHFYLVWPFLILLARTPKQVLLLAGGSLIISIAGRVLLLCGHMSLDDVFGLTPVRMDGLAIGASTAVLIRLRDIRRLWRPALAVLLGSILTLMGLVLVRHTTQQSDPAMWLLSFPMTSLATSATIILALAGGPIARLLSLGVLRWLGKYSFGLYVWHPIIGVLLLHSNVALTHAGAGNAQIILASAAVLALDVVVAWMSYHWVERRFLVLKRHFTPGASSLWPKKAAEPNGALAQIAQ